MKPKISVLLCTYNAPDLVRTCLDSILRQDFKNFEVICIDGMSVDNTLDVVKEYSKKDKRIRWISNKKGLPEGRGYGKWQGYNESKGDIVAIIDQDNILQKTNLFSTVVELFSKEKCIVGILGALKHDSRDEKVTRYISLVGTDSFFAYRSIDFLRNLYPQSSPIERFTLQQDNMPLTGGNCFFYSREALEEVGGYDQDVLAIKRMLKGLRRTLLVIKDATKHYAEKDMISLAKKKFFWGNKYYNKDSDVKRFNYLPKTAKERTSFLQNFGFNMLVLPNFFYSTKIYTNSKDPVIFLFPLMAFFNTLGYGLNFVKDIFSGYNTS